MVNRYKKVVEDFIEHLGDRASKPITVVTPREVQSFIAKRQKLKLSGTSVNIEANILRAAFNRARRQGAIPTNPTEAVDLPKKHSVERGVFTPAEIRMLLEEAKGKEWQTVIMFGYYTGARLGDCTKMEWDHVDLAEGTVKFFETKNQKWVTTPLHPDLQSHLAKIANIDKPQKFITPHMAKLGPGGRHGLSEGFKRIVVNAGIDLQRVEGTGVRNICRRTFHALRHSFTSALARWRGLYLLNLRLKTKTQPILRSRPTTFTPPSQTSSDAGDCGSCGDILDESFLPRRDTVISTGNSPGINAVQKACPKSLLTLRSRLC